jgi:hypothetical protein
MNIRYLVIAVASLYSISSLAGSWTGGGELFKDQRNPWFLSNTHRVKYCVTIDSENFGTSRDTAVTIIEMALKFWTDSLPLASTTSDRAKVGTQIFALGPCQPDTDLVFQLGLLSAEQMTEVREPQRFVAFANRQTYDSGAMRGRGYVYVSPQHGTLGLQRQADDDNVPIIEDRWQFCEGILLYRTLVHELGHVFGLPHFGAPNTVMAEEHLDHLMHPINATVACANRSRGVRNPFVEPRDSVYDFAWRSNENLSVLSSVFGSSIRGRLRFVIREMGQPIDVFSGTAGDQLLGQFLPAENTSWVKSPLADVKIFLPSNQQVFPSGGTVSSIFGYVLGPSAWTIRVPGKFRTVTNAETPMVIQVDAESLIVDAIDSDAIRLDIIPKK